MRSFILFAFAAFTSMALADSPPMPEAAKAAEAAWKADIEKGNEAYAKSPTAILKIDDAIYLKPGETAFLSIGGDGEYAWSLKEQAAAIASVKATDDIKTAMIKGPAGEADLLKEKAEPYAINSAVRVTGGAAQIEPGKDGVRVAVYNDANKDAAAFTGLDYYPYDPAFVVTARFEPAAKLEAKVFQTSRGWYKQFYHAGDAVFTLQGKDVRLPMYAGSDKLDEIDSLSAFIMDETTGKETYGVGRYVDSEIEKGKQPATVVINFNYLYNPNCARSQHYNCPVAVDRVPVAVTAGEKKPAGH